ncbi:MAG: (2Fe-2S)-binding protein, partial [Acidimicrobiales bacterium]
IEGLAMDGSARELEAAFHQHHALQCGYCTPGFLMAAHEFLMATPAPTEGQVRVALSGNLCRCTGYTKIIEAVLSCTT